MSSEELGEQIQAKDKELDELEKVVDDSNKLIETIEDKQELVRATGDFERQEELKDFEIGEFVNYFETIHTIESLPKFDESTRGDAQGRVDEALDLGRLLDKQIKRGNFPKIARLEPVKGGKWSVVIKPKKGKLRVLLNASEFEAMKISIRGKLPSQRKSINKALSIREIAQSKVAIENEVEDIKRANKQLARQKALPTGFAISPPKKKRKKKPRKQLEKDFRDLKKELKDCLELLKKFRSKDIP